MKALKLIFCLLFAFAISVTAQTYQQKGVVRMITTSASSPITPVAGVKVTVGNNVSKPTGSNGAFTMQVTQQFQVNGVTPSDEYILALPTSGKTYTQSPNDVDVIVTTKAKKDADYKALYAQLKKKYRQQSNELNQLRQEAKDRLEELAETDAEYAKVKAQLDSLQHLYTEYVTNEEKIDAEIKRISDELAITDYLSLDSIEKRVYELKCAGEWKTLSEFLHDVMRGDAAAFLQEGIDLEKQKAAELQSAQIAKATRFRLTEEQTNTFKMLHQYDDVLKNYKILINADSTNWKYLSDAANYTKQYIGNIQEAMSLTNRSIHVAPNDSLKSISFLNRSLLYVNLAKYRDAIDDCETAIKEREKNGWENSHAYSCLATIFVELDSIQDAYAYALKSISVKQQIYGSDNVKLCSNYLTISRILKKMDRYEEALKYCDRTIKIIEEKGEQEHFFVYAMAFLYKGLIYADMENYQLALENYQKALESQEKFLSPNHPDIYTCYANIATVLCKLGRFDEAMSIYQEVLSKEINIYGEEHPSIAIIYNNIANIYIERNQFNDGLAYNLKALQIRMKSYGEKHTSVANSYNEIGYVYHSIGAYDKAEAYFLKAKGIYEELQGKNTSDMVLMLNNLGHIKYAQRNYQAAIDHYDEAISVAMGIYGQENDILASLYKNVGDVYYSLKDYNMALEYHQNAHKIHQSLNSAPATVYKCYSSIGRDKCALGELDEGIRYYNMSIQIVEEIFGKRNEEYAKIKSDIAMAYLKKKQISDAISSMTEAYSTYVLLFGKDNPKTLNQKQGLMQVQFECAKLGGEESLREFMQTHVFVADIIKDGEASNRGLSGTYIWVQLCDWNIMSQKLFITSFQTQEPPFDIVLPVG